MKKLFYFISRIFFSKEKLLLIKLLNTIQDSTNFVKNEIRTSGICIHIWSLWINKHISKEEYELLDSIIKSNRPEETYNAVYYFEPHVYQPRFEFLKSLIKKY